MFAIGRFVSQSPATISNKEFYERAYLPLSSSLYNLVCKHACVRAHVDVLCVGILSSIGSPPVILPTRLTKGPPPGPAYLVCRNNEIMADALRLTKQCELFDGRFPPSLPDKRSPRTVIASFSSWKMKRDPLSFSSFRPLLPKWLLRPTRKDNVSER